MNVENALAFLEHYGVKGQRWGVRKERKAWRKEAKSKETATKVYEKAAESFAPVLKKINEQYPNMSDPKTRREYNAVVQTLFNDHLGRASIDLTMNSAGNRVIIYQMTPDGTRMRAIEMEGKPK